jgi:hypothetical protein
MSTENKINCWEFKRCGREPGGKNVEKYGPCPAATEERLDGFRGGKNAGRACWAVAGTMCGGAPTGIYALKVRDCMECDFHHHIIKEQEQYESAAELLDKIKEASKGREHKEPSFLKYAYEKAKKAAEEDEGVESLYISWLIAFTSFCPNISMLQASKRLCKDDLVDELWAIDAIADDKRRRATKVFLKTVFKGIKTQVKSYLDPLLAGK